MSLLRHLRLNKRDIFNTPRSNIRPLRKILHTLPALESLDVLLGIKINPNRVRPKRLASHEFVGCLSRLKVVELRLDHIAIGVIVVQAGSRTVVRAPDRLDPSSFALAIREQELGHRGERERDMLELRKMGL